MGSINMYVYKTRTDVRICILEGCKKYVYVYTIYVYNEVWEVYICICIWNICIQGIMESIHLYRTYIYVRYMYIRYMYMMCMKYMYIMEYGKYIYVYVHKYIYEGLWKVYVCIEDICM